MWTFALAAASLLSVAQARTSFNVAPEQGCLLLVEALVYTKPAVPNTVFYRPHAAWPVCPGAPLTFEPSELQFGNLAVYGGLKPIDEADRAFETFKDICIYGPIDLKSTGDITTVIAVDNKSYSWTMDASGTMHLILPDGTVMTDRTPCHRPDANDAAGQLYGRQDWLRLLPNPYDAAVQEVASVGFQRPEWNDVELSAPIP